MHRFPSRTALGRGLGLLPALAALACSGEVGDGTFNAPTSGAAASGGVASGPPSGGGRSGSAGAPSQAGAPGSGGGAVSPPAGGATSPPTTSASMSRTRVGRLTHEQYENSVRELFGIADGHSNEFAPDALNGFAFDTSVDYATDARLGPQYRTVAETLAEQAVTDDAVYARIVTCDESNAECPGTFIASFGERAFRRPLTAPEATRFRSLFDQGQALVGSGNAFRDGVRLVVEALLQSPQFLYRTELSATVADDGQIALDAWEVASRLSYLAWDSMPDSELFEAARSGALGTPGGLDAAARRLVSDPKARQKFVNFHEQAWQFGRFSKIAPDANTYPGLPNDLVGRVSNASRRFVDEVITTGGGLTEFLSAPYAFADSGLAPLYGVDVAGDLERVTFSGGERLGFLMQVGFLASNAHAIKTDPIHRGLFVMRDILCRPIGDPPPGASTMEPPPAAEAPKTTRDEVSLLTDRDGCSACHDLINPAGFAFEGFDAVGRARSEENDTAVDTTGSLMLDGTLVNFADARELVTALSTSQEARTCYVKKWLAFAYGHGVDASDDAAILSLAASAIPVTDLVMAIAVSPAMTKRWPNEVGP